MKKKLIIITFVLIILLVLIGILLYKNANKYNGNYEIQVKKIDDNSPDRHLIVLKDGKKTNDYKKITFKENKDIIICYQKNPTVNIFELDDINELLIILPNDKEVIAKIIKEEIWKRKYY